MPKRRSRGMKTGQHVKYRSRRHRRQHGTKGRVK